MPTLPPWYLGTRAKDLAARVDNLPLERIGPARRHLETLRRLRRAEWAAGVLSTLGLAAYALGSDTTLLPWVALPGTGGLLYCTVVRWQAWILAQSDTLAVSFAVSSHATEETERMLLRGVALQFGLMQLLAWTTTDGPWQEMVTLGLLLGLSNCVFALDNTLSLHLRALLGLTKGTGKKQAEDRALKNAGPEQAAAPI